MTELHAKAIRDTKYAYHENYASESLTDTNQELKLVSMQDDGVHTCGNNVVINGNGYMVGHVDEPSNYHLPSYSKS